MAYNSPLQIAIYDVMCDTGVFEVGFVGKSIEIAEKIKPHIDSDLLLYEDFNKNVRQILETRNNCARNKYIAKEEGQLESCTKEKYNHLIKRDIAVVKVDLKPPYGHNLYLFGCPVENIILPMEED